MAEGPDITGEQIKDLLEKGAAQHSRQDYFEVIGLLPKSLLPPPGSKVTRSDVFKLLLERVFDPSPDTSSLESRKLAHTLTVRAAREYLGWSDASYELIFDIATTKEGLAKPNLGPNPTPEQYEAQRQKWLASKLVRRVLASMAINGSVTSSKTLTDEWKQEIARDLLVAIEAFLDYPPAVQKLAKDLGIESAKARLGTMTETPTASPDSEPPVGEAEPPIESEPLGEPEPRTEESESLAEPEPLANFPRSPGLARRYLIAAALFLVVGGLIALALIHLPGRNGGSGTSQTGANGLTGQVDQTVSVSITDPPKLSPAASVPHDIVVAGPGSPEPSGYHRWIFVHAADGKYYPQPGRETNENNTWKIAGVTIGEAGTVDDGYTFTVYVLQVDDATDRQLTEYMSSFSPGFAAYSEDDWTNKFLRFKLDEVTVQRTG